MKVNNESARDLQGLPTGNPLILYTLTLIADPQQIVSLFIFSAITFRIILEICLRCCDAATLSH
jgi:hypothetical protein